MTQGVRSTDDDAKDPLCIIDGLCPVSLGARILRLSILRCCSAAGDISNLIASSFTPTFLSGVSSAYCRQSFNPHSLYLMILQPKFPLSLTPPHADATLHHCILYLPTSSCTSPLLLRITPVSVVPFAQAYSHQLTHMRVFSSSLIQITSRASSSFATITH